MKRPKCICEQGIGHWICVYYRHSTNKVYIYDSFNPVGIVTNIQKIIRVLYPSINVQTDIIMKPLKHAQQSAVSCGVFAAACATSLIFGKDPSNINFKICYQDGENEDRFLRQHLLNIVEYSQLSSFPEQ